ncbi:MULTISPECIES: hypothetical protein [Bacillus]|nr:hypothetical protein [Bacillus subtilis]
MKISQIILTVIVLSSILTLTHFNGENSASKDDFKIAADRVGA